MKRARITGWLARWLPKLLLASGLLLVGVPPALADEQTLEIIGPDQTSHTLDMSELASFPQTEITTSTPWTEAATYSGPLLQNVLQHLGLSIEAITAIGADGYRAGFSWAEGGKYQPILAIARNGAPLPFREQGPIWLLFPFNDQPDIQSDPWYFRAVWQVVRLEVH
ncbi:molybdopterin-dependent oxidoreductase [Rhodospirillum sp. A1_3_36]|uniref:molybdopterin-dependent oxidoreductase n=1 Tax=Rhodospirillum sp. A1_3_36 TaxID=3391666 RepID=UPI0039A60AF1